MPQIFPFYFVGQVVTTIATFSFIVYTISVYLIPALLQLNITRLFITKLLKIT